MSAFIATVLLPLHRLLCITLSSFLLLLLQPPLPCHSLLRMLPLLKRLRLPPLPCRRPLRRHPRRARAPGGWPPPRQELLRYCPPCCPPPRILPFLAPLPAAPPPAASSPAAPPSSAPPPPVLSSVAPQSTARRPPVVPPPAAPPPAALRHRTRRRPPRRLLTQHGLSRYYLPHCRVATPPTAMSFDLIPPVALPPATTPPAAPAQLEGAACYPRTLRRRSLARVASAAAEVAASWPGGAPPAFSCCGARHPPGATLMARRLDRNGTAERRSSWPPCGVVSARRMRSSRAACSPASGAFTAMAICSRVDRCGLWRQGSAVTETTRRRHSP